jgi:hypothetical protein
VANRIIQGSVPLSSTVTGTTASVTATIGTTSFTGRSVYLTGFSYQALATAATTVTITVSYAPVSGAAVTLGTWSYVVGTANPAPLDVNLIPPVQPNASITGLTNATTSTAVGSISITATAAGAGGIVALNLWGYVL